MFSLMHFERLRDKFVFQFIAIRCKCLNEDFHGHEGWRGGEFRDAKKGYPD